ncbi:MAG: DEAD/DEAH box helicase [Lentisphaeria bacterium]|nr:DEAD/DEAH box helicase [Lentisphaeria bacterium]
MSDNLAATFGELALSQGTLEILANRAYTTPTPIQAMVIPKLLSEDNDLIAQAQTGTGKTAAYALPVIERLLPGGRQKHPRAIVLSPTRELAMQIANEVGQFIGKRELKAVTVYGGQPIEIQLRALKGGADIIVGTPGRVIDLMERNALKLKDIRFAILDEADEMLNMGFVEDIETILAEAPEDKQMLMFSATVPAEARKIAEQFMHDARYIKAPAPEKQSIEFLTEQWACEVRREDKFNALKRILNAEGRIYGMIFCRTRADVDELTMNLQKNKFSAEALHGELTQNQRTRVIEQFKCRRFDMLVATDVAARGIDVNDLTHVINYALPLETDIYTHRIGRTGRAGKKGVAISIFSPSEGKRFAAIRKATNNTLELRSLPDAKAIIAAKKKRFRDDLEQRMSKANPVYWQMAEELSELYDPLAVMATMLDMKFHKELLPENYPALTKGKRDRQFGSMRGTHRDHTPENERRPRRRSEKASDGETAGNKGGKPERDLRSQEKKSHAAVSDRPSAKKRPENVLPEAKPRKKLRDWAMNLTENSKELPRYKVKKRK